MSSVVLGKGGSYPRKHTRPKKQFVNNEIMNFRQHRNTATLCMSSEECPTNKFCCEVIRGVFNICCGDPMRSVENRNGNVYGIPVPVEEEYPYDF